MIGPFIVLHNLLKVYIELYCDSGILCTSYKLFSHFDTNVVVIIFILLTQGLTYVADDQYKQI